MWEEYNYTLIEEEINESQTSLKNYNHKFETMLQLDIILWIDDEFALR